MRKICSRTVELWAVLFMLYLYVRACAHWPNVAKIDLTVVSVIVVVVVAVIVVVVVAVIVDEFRRYWRYLR